jgi:hypothetical protein
MLAGHPGARRAVAQWAAERDTSASAGARKVKGAFKSAFMENVAEHPELLFFLIEKAEVTEDTDFLVAALDASANLGHRPPASCDSRLDRLSEHLILGNGYQRRQGYRLVRAMVDHAGWEPPTGSSLAGALGARCGYPLQIALLELVRSAILSGHWSFEDVEPLLPVLAKMASAGPQRAKEQPDTPAVDRTAFARSVFAIAMCRLTPMDDSANRSTAMTKVLTLLIPRTPADGPLISEDIRELGRLIERLAPVEPSEAALFLLRISRALHAYDSRVLRPKREIANRWGSPLKVLMDQLGPVGQRKMILELVTEDIAMARRAVEVYASLLEASPKDPPSWFRELAHREDIHPTLRHSVAGRLRLHARTRCSSPWPELLRDQASL